jgi:hypothetical protein
MITRKDINKQFFSTCMGTGFGRVVILKEISMVGTVLMANVFDPSTPNPSNIPNMGSYWVNADKLVMDEVRPNCNETMTALEDRR